MRKIITIVLTILMLFELAGCRTSKIEITLDNFD